MNNSIARTIAAVGFALALLFGSTAAVQASNSSDDGAGHHKGEHHKGKHHKKGHHKGEHHKGKHHKKGHHKGKHRKKDRLASGVRGESANQSQDDGPGHDVNDDHGQDDGPGHDVNDDHGQDDGPGHDVNDDHGEHGPDHD